MVQSTAVIWDNRNEVTVIDCCYRINFPCFENKFSYFTSAYTLPLYLCSNGTPLSQEWAVYWHYLLSFALSFWVRQKIRFSIFAIPFLKTFTEGSLWQHYNSSSCLAVCGIILDSCAHCLIWGDPSVLRLFKYWAKVWLVHLLGD